MQKNLSFYVLFYFILFYNITASAQFESGVLWQVENSSSQKSLLFGTLHFVDKEMDDIYERIEKRISSARSVNIEYLITINDADIINKMLYKTDVKISSRLSNENFKKLETLIKAQNIPFEIIEYASPSAIYSLLANPKAISGTQMDFKIMNYAINNEIPLKGLDSAKNTFDIITRLDDTYCISAINEVLNDPGEFQKNINEEKSLYLKEDLAEMDKHMKNSISNPEMAKEFYDEAIIRRNRIMVDNLLVELEEGNTFAAVGMCHLTGEEGMLNLLSQHGYKITRIIL